MCIMCLKFLIGFPFQIFFIMLGGPPFAFQRKSISTHILQEHGIIGQIAPHPSTDRLAMGIMMQGHLNQIGCSTLILSALVTFFQEAQRLPCHRSYLMMTIILGLGLQRMVGITAPAGYCTVLFLHLWNNILST